MKRAVVLFAVLASVPASSDDATVAAVLASGRVHTIAVSSSERLLPLARLAPGDAPVLRFRYLEGKRRHRFGDLDLMMDDAGH